MIVSKRSILKAAGACVLVASHQLAFAGALEIAGSTTVQKAVIEKVADKAKAAGMPIKMMGVGSGKGVAMLIEGRVSVAAVSDELVNAIASARKAGATLVPENLKMHEIMTSGVVPAVHPQNAVRALTHEQIAGILSGALTRWSEVGGADAPINVVVPAEGSGTRGYVEKKILKGASFTDHATVMRTSAAELNALRRDPNAFAVLGAGLVASAGDSVKAVDGPKFTRPLALVTIGDPSPKVAELLKFLRSHEIQAELAAN